MRGLLAGLVVVAVFVALASIVMRMRAGEGEIAKSKRSMRAIRQGIEVFRMKQNRLPASLSELCGDDGTRCDSGVDGPMDPWGNDFVYIRRDKKTFDLVCLGSDGEEGGEGNAKDITLADVGEPGGD